MINIRSRINQIIVGNTNVKTFLITGFPNRAIPGMLYEFNHGDISKPDKRTGIRASINSMLHIRRADVQFDWKMTKKMDRLQASVESHSTGKLSDAPREEEKAALDAIVNLRNSGAGDAMKSAYVEVFLLVTISCDDKKVFKRKIRALKHNMKNVWGFKYNELKMEQQRALSATWMAGDLELLKDYHGRIMDLDALAAFYPFLDGSLSADIGCYIGHRIKDGTAVSIDFMSSSDNENMLVIGDTGSGKSAFIKALIEGMLAAGMKGYIKDVDGEYLDICEKYGGEWVDYSLASGKFVDPTIIEPSLLNEIDPSRLSESELLKAKKADAARYTEAQTLTRGVVGVLVDEFTTKKRNALEFALLKMWEDAGIDEEEPSTWEIREGVGIRILYEYIKEHAFSDDPKILFKKGSMDLMEDLWTYFEGGQKHMFKYAQSSDWIKDTSLTVFYIASSVDDGLDEKIGTAKLLMIDQMIWQQVKRDRLKKMQFSFGVDDEFQRLIEKPPARKSAYRNFTTARKFNYQQIAGFNDPTILKDNKGIWNNAKYNVLFTLKKDLIEEIATSGNIPREVVNEWLDLPEYGFIFRQKKNNKEAFDILRAELPHKELELIKTRGIS
ncbi:MAG: DUF87 domain-containing protein [Maledivibacter sp.]|nr:DUF87 domain-containing protein [Maledivibacter sp.]